MSASLCCATNIHRRFILSLAAFHNCQLVKCSPKYNIKKAIIVLKTCISHVILLSRCLEVLEGESFLKGIGLRRTKIVIFYFVSLFLTSPLIH